MGLRNSDLKFLDWAEASVHSVVLFGLLMSPKPPFSGQLCLALLVWGSEIWLTSPHRFLATLRLYFSALGPRNFVVGAGAGGGGGVIR